GASCASRCRRAGRRGPSSPWPTTRACWSAACSATTRTSRSCSTGCWRRAGAMGVELLHYRPWRGEFRDPGASGWPVARVSLSLIFRRKLFWAIYGLGLMMFLLFFFGQYLLAWAETQTGEQTVSVLGRNFQPGDLIRLLRQMLKLNGSGETYRN